MTWQLAILIQQLAEVTFALVHRRYSQRHVGQHFLTLAIAYSCVVAPTAIVWALVSGGFSLAFPLHIWALLLFCSLMFALGNAAQYVANTKLEVAFHQIIFSCRVVVAVVASAILLGEVLSPMQLPGAVIVLLSAVAVGLVGGRKRKRGAKPVYVLFSFAAAIVLGLAVVAEKSLLEQMPIANYVVIAWSLQALFLLALSGKEMKHLGKVIRGGDIKTVLLLGALRAVAAVCFVLALTLSDNAALISTITVGQVVLVAIGGYILLGERRNLLIKVGAATAASIGIIILISNYQ